MNSFADLCCLVHQRFGGIGVAFQEGECGSASGDHVLVAGLVAGLEEPEPAVEYRSEACRTGLEQARLELEGAGWK